MKAFIALALVGCSTSATIPAARFANAPPVTVVDDRRDVPKRPAKRAYLRWFYNLDGSFFGPLDKAFALPRSHRALGTTSLDEVPDSTWFTNRIGVREITPDQIRAGQNGVGNPEQHLPWTIHSTKVGGQSVGFIVTDARGKRFLIKFDERGFPEMETGAQLISGRLLWAIGYNVTEDYIAHIRREDLVLAKDAVAENSLELKKPLDRATVDRMLAKVEIKNGRIRTMASYMIDGKWMGGHTGTGTRSDDPNDRIPHERRRDLRGARAIFAWLDHIDIQEGQLLDMWVTDPADPNRHYVKHYLVDYGNSLGVMQKIMGNQRRGQEYIVESQVVLRQALTLGMWPRKWADRRAPELRGVGLYDIDTFAPGKWRPTTPAYTPLHVADPFDNYWGAKLVMRFTRAQLRAAVEAAKLTDPRAVDYLTDALVARQRATGAYWFSRVNPIDNIAATTQGVCFDDLMLTYRLVAPGTTQYSFQIHDRNGRAIGRASILAANATGRTCAALGLAGEGEGYTILRVSTSRPGFSGSTFVHLAREPETGAPRVIGIART